MLTHGCERPGAGKMASFEEWDAWVRQAVIYANELRPGQFGDVMEVVTIAQSVDPEQEALQHLLDAWVRAFGIGKVVTTADVMQKATSSDFGINPLRESLEEFTQGKMTTRSVGKLLRYRVGRIVGGKRLKDHGASRDGVRRWAVDSTEPKVTSPWGSYSQVRG